MSCSSVRDFSAILPFLGAVFFLAGLPSSILFMSDSCRFGTVIHFHFPATPKTINPIAWIASNGINLSTLFVFPVIRVGRNPSNRIPHRTKCSAILRGVPLHQILRLFNKLLQVPSKPTASLGARPRRVEQRTDNPRNQADTEERFCPRSPALIALQSAL